jgi:expansin (peptidoglycan-binding protein)
VGCGTDGASSGGGGSSGASGEPPTTTGAVDTPAGPLVTYGKPYEGGEFHLGPVDWEESSWHNACAPGTKYAPAVRKAEGTMLAGVDGAISGVADLCDACIWVTTAKGKSALLRVVTYGETSTNSIDVSPEAYAVLDSGESPRTMTWQLARCPDTGNVVYEFQTGSSEYWTSLWVRNARVPLAKVEVQSANHADFVALRRGGDGTLTDDSGFGNGAFSLRLTGVDGQQVTESFSWPSGGIAGQTLTGQRNLE